MLVNAADMLKKAEAGKYGLGAFNTNNLEWTLAILQAAEEAKSPLILQCTAGAAKWMGGFKVCADMVKAAVEATGVTVPVALHLDHGSYEDCFKCIEAGFTSIMYDGSHEETFQLNLDRTKELVELAHSKGMSIEAEVGGIGGTEDGVTSSGELADPAECKQIADLGVDFLACGIGNIHGVYPADWAGLSFERLGEIKARPATCPSFCTAAPASPRIRSRRPSPWAFPRSTSTPTCSSSSPRASASTSRLARISRARASTPASSSSLVATTSLPAPRSSWRSLAPSTRRESRFNFPAGEARFPYAVSPRAHLASPEVARRNGSGETGLFVNSLQGYWAEFIFRGTAYRC